MKRFLELVGPIVAGAMLGVALFPGCSSPFSKHDIAKVERLEWSGRLIITFADGEVEYTDDPAKEASPLSATKVQLVRATDSQVAFIEYLKASHVSIIHFKDGTTQILHGDVIER